MAGREIQNADHAGGIVRRRGRYRKASGRMTEQQHPVGVRPGFAAKGGNRAGDVVGRYSPDRQIVPVVAGSGEGFAKPSLRTAEAAAHDRDRRITVLGKRRGGIEEVGRRLLGDHGAKFLTDGARCAVNQHDERKAPGPVRPDHHGLQFDLASVRKPDRQQLVLPDQARQRVIGQSRAQQKCK